MVQIEQSVRPQPDESQLGPFLACDLLPGNQVRVMLHLRQQDLVPPAEEFASPGLGDEVDRHRRSRREENLLRLGGADEVADLGPRGLQLLVDVSRQLVIAAVPCVGVVALVTLPLFLDHAPRFLGRCRAVEINERPAVGQRPVEDRELVPNAFDVDRFAGRGRLRHDEAP